jgi:ribosome-binding ATPase YchF (GTP1/OBG family)
VAGGKVKVLKLGIATSTLGSQAACRAAGKLRVERKENIVKDRDVMHFLFNV